MFEDPLLAFTWCMVYADGLAFGVIALYAVRILVSWLRRLLAKWSEG